MVEILLTWLQFLVLLAFFHSLITETIIIMQSSISYKHQILFPFQEIMTNVNLANKKKKIKLIYINNSTMGNCSNQQRKPIVLANSNQSGQKGTSRQSQGLKSELICSQFHEIINMCINRSCSHGSLYCSDPRCSSVHSKCAYIQVSTVVKLIQKRLKQNQQFILDMQRIQKEMVEAVRERMKLHLSKILSQEVDKKYSQLVDAIYYKKVDCTFQGCEADDFLTKLKQSDQKRSQIQKNMLTQFKKQVQNISLSLNNVEGSIINQYIRQSKINFQQNSSAKNLSEKNEIYSKSLTQLQEIKEEISLNSSIVTSAKRSQIKLIMESLGQPRSIQLIFRASEHGFKASAFHNFCDNIPNTLTIISTEYGKTIVGFTPLTWNCTKGFAMDETEKSFLLSLELNKKMSLVRAQKTIQCIPSYGPVFGGGSDIAVADQCNTSKKSCTNFPYSYNCGTQFVYGQQSWNAFCGVKESKFFNIIQYEVFKVSW